ARHGAVDDRLEPFGSNRRGAIEPLLRLAEAARGAREDETVDASRCQGGDPYADGAAEREPDERERAGDRREHAPGEQVERQRIDQRRRAVTGMLDDRPREASLRLPLLGGRAERPTEDDGHDVDSTSAAVLTSGASSWTRFRTASTGPSSYIRAARSRSSRRSRSRPAKNSRWRTRPASPGCAPRSPTTSS